MTVRKQPATPDLPLRSLTQADGRLRPVQSFRRMRRQLIADMGGAANVPAARLAVLDVLAQATALAREEFGALLVDPARDPARFVGLGNLILGASRTLGLKRIPMDAVPTLHEYLEQKPDA